MFFFVTTSQVYFNQKLLMQLINKRLIRLRKIEIGSEREKTNQTIISSTCY